jgi:hypothetical protein
MLGVGADNRSQLTTIFFSLRSQLPLLRLGDGASVRLGDGDAEVQWVKITMRGDFGGWAVGSRGLGRKA